MPTSQPGCIHFAKIIEANGTFALRVLEVETQENLRGRQIPSPGVLVPQLLPVAHHLFRKVGNLAPPTWFGNPSQDDWRNKLRSNDWRWKGECPTQALGVIKLCNLVVMLIDFFYSEFFTGRFDTSGSMIPLSVSDISECDTFCAAGRGIL